MKFQLHLVAVLSLLASLLPAQTFPTGFSSELLVQGLSEPDGLAWLPDGRLLIVEQRTALVKVWIGGTTATSIGTIPNVRSTGNEQGLLAIAVDPQWPARNYIYVWYNTTVSANIRLSMFAVNGDLSNPASANLTLGTAYHILTDTQDNASNHNGGAIRFGPDGNLYLSVGDDASGCNAQNTSTGLGCLMRLNVSSLPGAGSGPPAKSVIAAPGNPFTTPVNGNATLVWAYGFRNPYRHHIDPVTGKIYVADVGLNTVEEIDEVNASTSPGGQNFGWPYIEGNVTGTGCGGSTPVNVAPIATLNHSTGAASIMSMGVYHNTPSGIYNFGPSYEGDYFFNDYFSGTLRRLKLTGSTWAIAPAVPGQPNATEWGTGFTSVPDTLIGPDGALYYVTQFPGALRRLKPNTNSPQLTIVQGNGQAANAGRQCYTPLKVRLATFGGTPIANAPVTFTVTAGGGSVSTATVTTDAQGFAQTNYTMAAAYSSNPAITVSSPGAASVPFNLVWRGITVSYVPAIAFISATVRHSQVNSPITFAFDAPVASPFVTTNFNDIWTSVLAPLPSFGAFDGLGLVGPADPLIKTAAASPIWTKTQFGLPIFGGLTLRFQAYALDTALLPSDAAIMVSNFVDVTLN